MKDHTTNRQVARVECHDCHEVYHVGASRHIPIRNVHVEPCCRICGSKLVTIDYAEEEPDP